MEDSQWELKSDMPTDPNRVARRLGAHANAAQGERIIWVFGLDEKKGIVGCEPFEASTWISQLSTEFAGPMPELVATASTNHEGVPIQAFEFATDAAPYLVKNPQYGTVKGTVVSREVPWRKGESTDSATREQLLRLLAPVVRRPQVQLLRAFAELRFEYGDPVTARQYRATIDAYVSPLPGQSIVFPRHLIQMRMRDSMANSRSLRRFDFDWSKRSDGHATNVVVTNSEVIFTGPGSLKVVGSADAILGELKLLPDSVIIELALTPVLAEWQLRFEAVCDVDERGQLHHNGREVVVPIRWGLDPFAENEVVHFDEPARNWTYEAIAEVAKQLGRTGE